MGDKDLLQRFLGQYKTAKRRKHNLAVRLATVRIDMDMPLSGNGYSDLPKGNSISEGAATLAIRARAIEEKIEEQKKRMADLMLQIMEVIELLPSTSAERAVIEHKYIDCMSWNKIAEAECYSRSSCFEYWSNGLDKLLEFDRVNVILDEFKKAGA